MSCGRFPHKVNATAYRRVGVLLAGCVLLLAATRSSAVAPAAIQAPTGAAHAQPSLRQGATFTHITIEQGLSDQRVQAIVQDRVGFLWFGTNNGLNRYDGYDVVAYRHDPTNPHSLSGNFVEDLYEDRSGTLWVSTRSGLNAFDRRTERFTWYRHDPTNPRSLSHNTVIAITEDRAGGLWLGTAGGLNRFDRLTETFTTYHHDPANPQSLSHNTVRVITRRSRGGLVAWHPVWAQPLRPRDRDLHHLSPRPRRPAQPQPRCRLGHPRGSGWHPVGGDRWWRTEPLRPGHRRFYPLPPRSAQPPQSGERSG
jgi:ligand-binding sensor domain-containing protein